MASRSSSRLSAQALGAAVLGLHFFATCSAVNASTSPPRRPQQCPNLAPVRASAEYPASRNSLLSGRWNHRTKNCTARNPAGRCFYRRSRQHYANDWKPIRKPLHGPRSFPVRGGRSPIVAAQQPEFHRARPPETLGEVCILGHIRFRTHTDAFRGHFRGHFRICTAEFHTYAFAVVAD